MEDPSATPDAEPGLSAFNRFIVSFNRRRVGRVAITYAAVAWFLIEVAGTTFPMVGIADAYGRLLLILLLVGFPVALVLGWLFDIGPGGVERTDGPDADHPPAGRPSRAWAFVATGAAVGAGLMWGIPWLTANVRDQAAAGPMPANVIAVLPFGVRGAEPLAYLGEGVVDLVSAKLHGAGEIRTVDPRLVMSAVRSRVDQPDPADDRAVARDLGAGQFLTGEVVEAGGRIRITAQLHSTRPSDAPSPQASVEGAADGVFGILDQLVAELLAGSLEAEGHRFEADSTFALAYYRKSIAADWIDAFTSRTDADKAFEYRGSLPLREPTISMILSPDMQVQIRDFYSARGVSGVKALPPGIRKRLARGKALPPGIAKQVVPEGLRSRIRLPSGYEIVEVGLDVLLVEVATDIIHDVLMDVVS